MRVTLGGRAAVSGSAAWCWWSASAWRPEGFIKQARRERPYASGDPHVPRGAEDSGSAAWLRFESLVTRRRALAGPGRPCPGSRSSRARWPPPAGIARHGRRPRRPAERRRPAVPRVPDGRAGEGQARRRRPVGGGHRRQGPPDRRPGMDRRPPRRHPRVRRARQNRLGRPRSPVGPRRASPSRGNGQSRPHCGSRSRGPDRRRGSPAGPAMRALNGHPGDFPADAGAERPDRWGSFPAFRRSAAETSPVRARSALFAWWSAAAGRAC